MTMNPQDYTNLVAEIRTLLLSQVSKENIYSTLITRGIDVDNISKAYGDAIGVSYISQDKPQEPNTPISQSAKHVIHEDTAGKAVKTIVTIGAIMIALGIFTFVAANWSTMSSVLKVSILLVSMIFSYSLGWYFQYKTEQESLGKALIFLGVLIYGASIFLVAQIFNIRANWPDGFLLWMIGTFLVAYSEKSDGLRVLAIILAVLGAGGYAVISGSFIIFDATFYSSNLLLLISAAFLFFAGLIVRKRVDLTNAEYY